MSCVCRVALGYLTVNVAAAEVPPAAVTVTLTLPAVAIRLAGTRATSSSELTNTVSKAVLPNFVTALSVKLVPSIINRNATPPLVAESGLKLVMVGSGGLMVNVAPVEVPPAVVTVTLILPAVAIRLAGTDAASSVELMNIVVSAVPPHLIVAADVKFLPLTVRRNAAPPAVAELGLKLVIVGSGGLMVNVAAAEVPPAVVTVTLAVPTVEIRLAGTEAVSSVELTRIVVSAVPPHLATAPEAKFVPSIFSVKATPPAVAESGLRLVIVGIATMPVPDNAIVCLA